jgi:hypothetical protein
VNTARTIGRIAAVLAMVSAPAALAGVAQADTPPPPGMSEAAYQSLILRSQALNQEAGFGPPGAVPQGMAGAEYRALMLRSAALNQMYGLGTQERRAG